MNAIVPFIFDDQAVRVTDQNGQPWFVLADICALLGIRNASDSAGNLDDTEKARLNLGSGSDATIVNLAGLLTVMLRCRGAMKPGTVPYRVRKWITGEVVPAIMRTGSYGTPATDLNDNATLRALLLGRMDQAEALRAANATLIPKAEAFDRLTHIDGEVPPTQAAKLMGVKPGKLFDWLEDHGWVYRGADGLVARQTRIDTGYMVHKAYRVDRPRKAPKMVNRALLTPKGIARLTELGAGRE